MLRRRVIPCLDVANGRVVKGTRFIDLVDEGDPPELAERYAADGADELVFLDISAAPGGTPIPDGQYVNAAKEDPFKGLMADTSESTTHLRRILAPAEAARAPGND